MKLHKPIKFQEISYISDICFQTRQPVFVQLLSAGFRVSQCHFVTLSVDQRVNVENCIRTLSEVAKARAIAIPSDLDMKVSQNEFHLRSKLEIFTSPTFQLSFILLIYLQVAAMFNKTAMISLKTGKQWYTISRGRTIKRELSSTSVSKNER